VPDTLAVLFTKNSNRHPLSNQFLTQNLLVHQHPAQSSMVRQIESILKKFNADSYQSMREFD
jgi:hypothetical protein